MTGFDDQWKIQRARRERNLRLANPKSLGLKLSEEDKEEIRKKLRSFANPNQLARVYGVTPQTILRCMKGK